MNETFEDKFPNLSKLIDFSEPVIIITNEQVHDNWIEAVYNTCIDKQIAKETIIEELSKFCDKHYVKFLLKKLGLEDE